MDRERPILFVANHQYLAMDLSLIYDQLLEEKNILPRGLGHPAIFDGRAQPGPLGNFVRDVFSAFGAGEPLAACMPACLQRDNFAEHALISCAQQPAMLRSSGRLDAVSSQLAPC